MSNPGAAAIQNLQVHEIRFIGEQDGPPERLLKKHLSAAFVFHRHLERAYLAQIQYVDRAGVVLCIRCVDGQDPQLVEVVGEIFGSIFGAHEHLDILFVSEDQEPALRRVCRPFYSAAGKRD
jgi:hypothetical protein